MLLGKLQKGFGTMHVDVLVAVSDGGLIRGGKHVPAEVLKADQVPGRLSELIRGYRKANSMFSLNLRDMGYEASSAELSGIAAFLNARHLPPGRAETVPAPTRSAVPAPSAAPPPPTTRRGLTGVVSPPHQPAVAVPPATRHAPTCRHCQSGDIAVQYGKYGYYLRCASCGGNTPAKPVCPTCQGAARLSKRGPEFTAACAGGHEWRYWTNG